MSPVDTPLGPSGPDTQIRRPKLYHITGHLTYSHTLHARFISFRKQLQHPSLTVGCRFRTTGCVFPNESFLAWQLLGFRFKMGTLSGSDLKPQSFDMVRKNFPELGHFFQSLDDQLNGRDCLIHPGGKCNECNPAEMECPDLAVTGTPCQPFSKQRVKRSAPGSVASHKSYNTTMKDLIAWLDAHSPKCAVVEQVEGMEARESASSPTSPLDSLLGHTSDQHHVLRFLQMIAEKKDWENGGSNGGYHTHVFHLDASLWIDMSRPRRGCLFGLFGISSPGAHFVFVAGAGSSPPTAPAIR